MSRCTISFGSVNVDIPAMRNDGAVTETFTSFSTATLTTGSALQDHSTVMITSDTMIEFSIGPAADVTTDAIKWLLCANGETYRRIKKGDKVSFRSVT